ncbi:hypothetical protein AMJ44_10330 [candidate division WOR-1 bacterium DG_54_3]|uniref:Uncharacterized protein n=1 Tax=candidate division WOR-1 bacterium DG_54_3 TaxID=1703775 RepID=A0A0S7XT81_UNCSA|nr:MAG: hypothetical protein AMJ44_10330 [candidate division WOR-1 bacterium DG_54_3]
MRVCQELFLFFLIFLQKIAILRLLEANGGSLPTHSSPEDGIMVGFTVICFLSGLNKMFWFCLTFCKRAFIFFSKKDKRGIWYSLLKRIKIG